MFNKTLFLELKKKTVNLKTAITEMYQRISWELFADPFGSVERALITAALDLNPLTPNDDYSGRTAPLTSKRCILYIYSTNIDTEHYKHGIYCPFFPLQNAVCFINLTYLVPVLFTFYIQGVLIKKNNSGAKRLIRLSIGLC